MCHTTSQIYCKNECRSNSCLQLLKYDVTHVLATHFHLSRNCSKWFIQCVCIHMHNSKAMKLHVHVCCVCKAGRSLQSRLMVQSCERKFMAIPNVYMTKENHPVWFHHKIKLVIIAQYAMYLKHGYKKCVIKKGFMFVPFQIRRKISSPAANMTTFSLIGIAPKVTLQFRNMYSFVEMR